MLQPHLSTWNSHVKQAVTKITENPHAHPPQEEKHKARGNTSKKQSKTTLRIATKKQTKDRRTEHKHQQGTKDQEEEKKDRKRKDCLPEVGGLQCKQKGRTTEKQARNKKPNKRGEKPRLTSQPRETPGPRARAKGKGKGETNKTL